MNQSINQFKKVFNNLKENVTGVLILIDEREMKIWGNPKLENALFEIAPYIVDRHLKGNGLKTADEKPEGTTCFLEPLPPGGVSKMTITQIENYWSDTMRATLPERGPRNLGYKNPK